MGANKKQTENGEAKHRRAPARVVPSKPMTAEGMQNAGLRNECGHTLACRIVHLDCRKP